MLLLLSRDGVGWAAVSLGHLGLEEARQISALPLAVRKKPQPPRLFPWGSLCKLACFCIRFEKKMGKKKTQKDNGLVYIKEARQVIEIIVFFNLLIQLEAPLFASHPLSAPCLFLSCSAIFSPTHSQNSALLITLRTVSLSRLPILQCLWAMKGPTSVYIFISLMLYWKSL